MAPLAALLTLLLLLLHHPSLRVAAQQAVTLDAGGGLQWRILGAAGGGYALGQPLLAGRPLDSPVSDALVYARRLRDQYVVPLLADRMAVAPDAASALLSASASLPDGGPNGSASAVQVSVRIQLQPDFPAARLALAFSSAPGAQGWQLCIKWMHDGPTAEQWRLQGYPRAGNSSSLASTTRLDYFGWPGFFVYRPNASVVAYFGLDIADDFSNPTTWTGATTFGFQSQNGYQVAPQFMFGGVGMKPGEVYEAGMTLHFARETSDMLAAVRDIVPALLRHSAFTVAPMPTIRTPPDSLACFLNARRTTPMWSNTPNGTCYELQQGCGFCYLGTTTESAFFEYQMYLLTNTTLWRTRAFSQMAFWLQGQNLQPSDRHFGAVHTTYDLPNGPYNSQDRGTNVGWKIDLNSHMARYALLLWEAVLKAEGVNNTDWYVAADRSAQWVWRMAAAQAGRGAAPGSAGFPQRIVPDGDAPTPSVVSGRTMNALPVFQRLLQGNADVNYTDLRANAEAWLMKNIEGLLYFSGQHPDLEFWDYEQDSVWEIVEYWLNTADEKRAAGGDPRPAIDRAVGDAYVGLMMLCPKQLAWVDNPTQMAADEQQEYDQYTVYTYHNKKWVVLQRLARVTGDNLWQQLADRLFQLNMFTQGVSGAPDTVGGYHEAIADPWLARGGGYNFVGSVYLNELALDLSLQMVEMGVQPTAGFGGCVIGGGGGGVA